MRGPGPPLLQSVRTLCSSPPKEVPTEFLAAVSAHGDHTRRLACRLVREILGDPGIEVAAQSHESFLAGLALYERRPDKQYSLADCISMNVIRQRGIQDVLTNDRHLAQEGFKRLLDPNLRPPVFRRLRVSSIYCVGPGSSTS